MSVWVDRINSSCVESYRNATFDKSYLYFYGHYVSTFGGTANILNLVNKIASLGNEIYKNAPIQILQDVAASSKTALSSFGIIRLPCTTQKAYKSICTLNSQEITCRRKVLLAVGNVMGAVADWCSTTFFLSSNVAFKWIGATAKLSKQFSEFPMSISDYKIASDLAYFIEGGMKEVVEHSRDYYFYRVLKNVLAIASCIFALCTVIFKVSLLPTIATISLSLFVALLSIQMDLYKDYGKYSILRFEPPLPSV